MGCCPGPSRPCASGRDDSRKPVCQNPPGRPKSPFLENPTRRPRSAFFAPWAVLKPAPEAAAGAGIALPCLLVYSALHPRAMHGREMYQGPCEPGRGNVTIGNLSEVTVKPGYHPGA